MSATIKKNYFSEWSGTEKFVFRLFALYFFLQALPLDVAFFSQLTSLIQHPLHYNDIFNLAHYSPKFLAGPDSFTNWGIVFLIALIGAIIWSVRDKSAEEYNNLYYWVRVVVRYRLAIGVIAYGFIKLYPIQSPLPSLSNLNTNYGDFTRWKLFSLSLGIVPSYQSFLGLVEIITGVLLLFRKTAVIGALFVAIFTGNVFMSNLAYEGGQSVYSLYLISFALFLLVYDIQRIINLLVLQRPTAPNRFKPHFNPQWQRSSRLALKSLFIFFFVILYGFKTKTQSKSGLTLYPETKGLPGAAGIYNVSEFRLNDSSIAYSKTHPVRWQDVVFEKWNTISIKSNRPVIIDSNNVDKINEDDRQRNYELEGEKSRHYFRYEIDSAGHLLKLQNKNPHYKDEKLVLKYELTPSKIILSGVDQNNDELYVVLDKIDKKYLLEEVSKQGRRGKLKL
jgi:hypothetical protein